MNYLIYQLKVAIVLLIFYTIYKIFISNSTQFGYKRIFILGSILVAYLVPVIKIKFDEPEIVNYYNSVLPEVVVGGFSKVESVFDYQYWLLIFFYSVSLLMLIFFFRQILAIIRLAKTSNAKSEKGFVLVETDDREAFTFFRYIFLSKTLSGVDRDTILQHEKIHASLLHSIDNFIVELVLIMQWFNPVMWLFQKAIKQNHEFEADKIMLNQGVSVDNYQQLLINQLFQTSGLRFSSFNYNSFIKNRIKMMTNMKARAGKTRFLLATIMSLFVVSLFAFKAETISQIKEVKYLKVESNIPSVKDTIKEKKGVKNQESNKLFLVVDQTATFQGKGLEEFSKYVMDNVVYPAEAVQNKMQGKVFVQFVVEKDGTIKDAKIVRGVGEVLDKEVIRVVKSSPAWTPAKHEGRNVRQAFTLPIVFALK